MRSMLIPNCLFQVRGVVILLSNRSRNRKREDFFGRENTQKNFGKENTRGILAERITEERAEKEFLAEIHTRAIFF